MSGNYRARIIEDLKSSRDLLTDTLADQALIATVANATQRIIEALRGGHKILIAGNGGSAADAQHIAGELVGRFNFDREPLPAVALTTDGSTLTAIGNDYGFDQTFARQVEALGRAGDVLLCISTSGRSRNILAALRAARKGGLATIGLTGGSSGDVDALCDHLIRVPSNRTPFVQQVHITIAHIICALTEEAIFVKSNRDDPP
jgi:D-sedoheptulose 7-phosphate isomerase